MAQSPENKMYGVLNPLFTIISFIILGVILADNVKEKNRNLVLLGTIGFGLFISVVQVYRFARMAKEFQTKTTEEILEGQRKLVRELFKEDFENEDV